MNYFDDQIFPLFCSSPDYIGHTANVPLYYGIQYNHRGAVSLEINGRGRVVREGPHVFITHPGAFFEYSNVGNSSRHHCFICSYGRRIESYIQGGLLELDSDPPLIPVANPDRFLLTMLEIMSLVRKTVIAPPRAVLLYEDLLLQIRESMEKRNPLPPYRKKMLQEMADKIRKNPEKEYDFDCEARKCCISTAHLRRIFRQVYGVPPQHFLIHCRLEKAAKLLLETEMQVVEAAEASGIPNRYYFSKLFREKYRITPIEYRREFK